MRSMSIPPTYQLQGHVHCLTSVTLTIQNHEENSTETQRCCVKHGHHLPGACSMLHLGAGLPRLLCPVALAACPQVREEATQVFSGVEEGAGLPSRRAVDTMIFTLSVLKETLRKYSVVPVVTRELVVDDELLGHKVPRGTMIVCVMQVCAVCCWLPALFLGPAFGCCLFHCSTAWEGKPFLSPLPL